MPGFDTLGRIRRMDNDGVNDSMFARSLPSLFTIGNLVLGILSIILVFNGGAETAAMLVILAMLLDGLDGRVARALNVQSEFGKELDSLSDVISFGVAPAFVLYAVAFQGHSESAAWAVVAWTATSLFPVCGALRLARFNVTDGTGTHFTGLPIPAAGGVLAIAALFHAELTAPVLVVVELALSVLMISTVKYPNFKQFRLYRRNLLLLTVLVASLASLAIFNPGLLLKLMAVPLVIYALLGLRENPRRMKRPRRRKDADDRTQYGDP
mgnify:CR=1 FL=1|jgi:CDP-diacylglycerol--serine O-phosphatidyltransferase